MRRAWTAAILVSLAGCGDDGATGGDTGVPGTTTDATGTTAITTGSDATTDATDTTSAPTEGTTDGGDAESSTGVPGDESSTGGGPLPIELFNDGWPNSGRVGFQMGFVMNECWASTYVPEPEHYPFEVIAASMVVGGEDMGDADFSFAIWSVDDANQPMTELAVGSANISGDDNAIDTVPLEIIGIVAPPFESGNFAIVVCFTSHGGLPAIARDTDGLTHEDRNWIRLEDGTWVPSAQFGVDGDWIMRAVIRPM